MDDIQTTTILNLAEKTSLDSADAFVIDTASGTKKITQENIIDDTLEMSGKFADAKAVGDAIDAQGTTLSASIATNTANIATNTANIATNTTDIADLKADLAQIVPGLSDEAKVALLACFEHVAWIDEHGQDYYDALEDALYADSYPRITAVFNAGVNVIYTDDALDTLKQYLTVKYFATKESTGTVIASNDYTLSGVLTEGTSTITVGYEGVRTSVSIPSVVDFYNIWEWDSRFTGAGKLTRLLTNTSEKTVDGVRRGIEYASHGLPNNNRRSFCVNKGKHVFIDRNGNPTSFYPVPVPKTATKLTATVTPSTQQLAAYVYKYEGDVNSAGYNYLYYAPSAISWKTGVDTYQFAASDNLFVSFNMRVDASSTQYTDGTEPELNLLFE